MSKSPKRPRDPAQLAKLVVDIASGNVPSNEETKVNEKARKAGLVGGPARAKVLTEKRRSEIAKAAARTRWKA